MVLGSRTEHVLGWRGVIPTGVTESYPTIGFLIFLAILSSSHSFRSVWELAFAVP